MDQHTIDNQLLPFFEKAIDYGFLNSDLTSKLTDRPNGEWEKAWEARIALVPEEGMFKKMEKIVDGVIDPVDFALEKPAYGLGLLLEGIGFFDLFSGDGRSREYTGKQGVKEWLLLRRKPDSFQSKNLKNFQPDRIEDIFKESK